MMKWIRTRLSSLKVRLLWPVALMMVVMVLVLIAVVTRTYTSTILEQEDAKVQSSFAITGGTMETMLNSAISVTRDLLQNEAVERYAVGSFARSVDRVLARQALMDELTSVLKRQPDMHGVLYIRENGSAFGLLSLRSFFFDEDSADILNEDMLEKIQQVPWGRMVWLGPISGEELYRLDGMEGIPDRVMLGASVSRSVSYGRVYSVTVVDAEVLGRSVDLLADGRSSVYLTNSQGVEIARTGGSRALTEEAWQAVASGAGEGSVTIEQGDGGERMYVGYRRIDSLSCYLIRELPLAEYDRTVVELRNYVLRAALMVFAVAMCVYLIWLRGFMKTFDALRSAIDRLRKGDLEGRMERPFPIAEFEDIRREFNGMNSALETLMETTRAMERSQLELELRALQTQLSPHMIFNSITAIRWMATMVGADRVSDMLMELSEMLRPVFRDWAIEWSLGEELQHLSHYARLLDLRYGNNFSMTVEVPEQMHSLRIPRFTLQPLVENACEHGGASAARLHVAVRARMDGGSAEIAVRDDGAGIPPETIEAIHRGLAEGRQTGRVGLYSVYNRLRICMGDSSSLRVRCPEEGGAEVIVRWPAREVGGGSEVAEQKTLRN